MSKYKFENGVMKLNPAYQEPKATQGSLTPHNPQALAVISSTQDIQIASEAQEKATGMPMQISEATIASMEIMQDKDYLEQFHTKQKLDGGDLLDGLSKVFEKYEVPIGLVNKLLALTEYSLNFIIDDSGSMNTISDLPITAAHAMVKSMRDPKGKRAAKNDKLTRWEEAEDRIHIMLDMLAYLPIDIKFAFLNNKSKTLVLKHDGKTPEQFSEESHQKISNLFSFRPKQGTPLYTELSCAFKSSSGNTMHYVFTDGEPSDATIDEVKNLVKNRPNPKMNPLTFISCTSNDEDAQWMKDIEEAAPFTAELDDFNSERNEVLKDQGPAFPFTRGFWLICHLAAAINPHDLDALDESIPFTKKTMNDLMGRNITIQEYRRYFQNNPNANRYAHLSQQFEREDILARDIINPHSSSITNNLTNNQVHQPSQTQYPTHQEQPPSQYQVNQPISAASTSNNTVNQAYPPQQSYQGQTSNYTPQQYMNAFAQTGGYPNTFFNTPTQQPTQPPHSTQSQSTITNTM